MEWIYISPHLDDVVYSCGGLIWEQVHNGDKVSVWTIFSGDPEFLPISPFADRLHKRWGIDSSTIEKRRQEDLRACTRLDVSARHFNFQEAIYRIRSEDNAYLYPTEESIFGIVAEDDAGIHHQLRKMIADSLPANAHIVFPMSIGRHVDHVITKQCNTNLTNSVYFYADFPYALRDMNEQLLSEKQGIEAQNFHLSDRAVSTWIEAIYDYESQFNTFWLRERELELEIANIVNRWSGVRVWRNIRT